MQKMVISFPACLHGEEAVRWWVSLFSKRIRNLQQGSGHVSVTGTYINILGR